jgi:hypothetical protein
MPRDWLTNAINNFLDINAASGTVIGGRSAFGDVLGRGC